MMLRWIIGIAISLVILSASFSCSAKDEEAEIRALVENKCSMCHFSKRIYQQPRPKEEWNMIVPRMRALNPTLISKEDAKTILEFLNEHVSE